MPIACWRLTVTASLWQANNTIHLLVTGKLHLLSMLLFFAFFQHSFHELDDLGNIHIYIYGKIGYTQHRDLHYMYIYIYSYEYGCMFIYHYVHICILTNIYIYINMRIIEYENDCAYIYMYTHVYMNQLLSYIECLIFYMEQLPLSS